MNNKHFDVRKIASSGFFILFIFGLSFWMLYHYHLYDVRPKLPIADNDMIFPLSNHGYIVYISHVDRYILNGSILFSVIMLAVYGFLRGGGRDA